MCTVWVVYVKTWRQHAGGCAGVITLVDEKPRGESISAQLRGNKNMLLCTSS